MPTSKRPDASWSDLKAKLAALDRSELIALVRDLYAASKEDQAFLHTRFGVGGDVLKPYLTTVDRWLWPDVFRGQGVSVVKAKKAITDYRNAEGQPQGLAELTVFFCERASGFAAEVGKVGIAPRLFLKKLVADVLDRVDLHADFDPRKHYRLTLADSEMSVAERAATGASSVDDIEL